MKNESYRVPFDSDQCFFVQDFVPGDSLLLWKKGARVRAVVQKVDTSSMEIVFRTSTTENNRAKLDDIIFLKELDKTWLK